MVQLRPFKKRITSIPGVKRNVAWGLCTIILITSAFILWLSATTFAEDTQIRFDIPAQDIRSALIKFADVTDLSMIYNIEELEPMETNGVYGRYSPLEALKIMLANKGLKFKKIGEESIAISKNEHPSDEMTEKSDTAMPAVKQQKEVAKKEEKASEDLFILEQITVTAEKRAENLQRLPGSVVVLLGNELTTQGKIETGQFLESVPNVTFREGYGTNPDGNIAIRGIQRTQASGGVDEVLPATTAVYVDGVYLGIGGHYDLNRIEVLRGPQGTLYGRSATGGVVAFYTNDPKPGEFGGDVTAEFGNYSLVNAEGVVNVPVGDKVAFRAAAHYYSRDGYFDKKGGQTETREGRLKILFQPTDPLQIVLSGSIQRTVNWGGGWSVGLSGPDTIDYHYAYSTPSASPTNYYNQVGVNADYDFGSSTLTYVGGYHDYKYTGLEAETATPTQGGRGEDSFPKDWYHTEEIRWASDTDMPVTWLVGANYFKQEYEQQMGRYQTWNSDPEVPADQGLTPAHLSYTTGNFLNYGLFTEETFKLRDDFRITAGLRYDKTDFTQSMTNFENVHYTSTPWTHAVLMPPIWMTGSLNNDKHKWNDITYKLRFEYDVAPNNMLYFTTATGFLPGYASVGPLVSNGELIGWDIRVLSEQKLTSYELGAKNQFLDNRLRVNGAVFYYDLAGYPEAYNLSEVNGPGFWFVLATPIEVIGAEVEAEYLLTMNDKISFTAGYERPKIAGYPDSITWRSGSVTPGRYAAMLDTQPGHPTTEATLDYDHIFNLGNGSTLMPRVEVHYTGEYYLSQINYIQINAGMKPYDHQDAVVLCNANVAWTSPGQKYSVNAWVRNVFDREYKRVVNVFGAFSPSQMSVTPGDPRTFGIAVRAMF